jgi:hypothetical protein
MRMVALVAALLTGVAVGWVIGHREVSQLRQETRELTDSLMQSRRLSERTLEQEEIRAASLVDAIRVSRHQLRSRLLRVIGSAWGQGFGEACQQLNAPTQQCDEAWGHATGFCLDLGTGDELCFPPISRYFHTPDMSESKLGSLLADAFLDIARELCGSAGEPSSLGARDQEELREACSRLGVGMATN